jgi:hypothetical protein
MAANVSVGHDSGQYGGLAAVAHKVKKQDDPCQVRAPGATLGRRRHKSIREAAQSEVGLGALVHESTT